MKTMQTGNKEKQAVVVQSGGFDSATCLAMAIKDYGSENVLSVSFDYGQRHSIEIEKARHICAQWNVEHTTIKLDIFNRITSDALIDHTQEITWGESSASTLTVGRNGLMAHLAGIFAHNIGAHKIYLGVMAQEAVLTGYRDCSREYMDLKQQLLRLDLDDPSFEVLTPLVDLNKLQAMELAHNLGVLPFLLQNTISCYRGLPQRGCQNCPSCLLRNNALDSFAQKYPSVPLPYP